MSRIGKLPISVPDTVKVSLDPKARTITLEGPKGKLFFTHRPEVHVAWDEGEKSIHCTIDENRKKERSLRAQWGTTRAQIQNMIVGVTQGYTIKLEVIGVGWSAKAAGRSIQLHLGFCNTIAMVPPQGVEFAIEGATITVTGIDKAAVGEFAAEVRAQRPPEPYKGKGVKYVDEVITRKQGKVFGA